MKRYLYPEHYASVPHQVLFLLVTCALLALILYKPVVEFHPVGPAPFVEPVTQDTVQQWGGNPVYVQAGMHITDFLKFDAVKNEFVVNAFIWFLYDAKQVKKEVIDAFGFTKGEFLQKSQPKVWQENGKTLALYTIRVQFSSILNFKRFPLDDHRLFMNLTNPLVSAQELVYQVNPNDFVISPTMYISGWKVVGQRVTSGYAIVDLGEQKELAQSKTVFALHLSKGDIRQLLLIFLPLLFLFYLGLFAFSIRDISVAMTLPLASVSGLFAYSFVIQILAPAVGYMMLSDHIFFFFLCAIFIIFFVKAMTAIPETHLSRHRLKQVEGVTIIGLQILLIIVWYFLMDVTCL